MAPFFARTPLCTRSAWSSGRSPARAGRRAFRSRSSARRCRAVPWPFSPEASRSCHCTVASAANPASPKAATTPTHARRFLLPLSLAPSIRPLRLLPFARVGRAALSSPSTLRRPAASVGEHAGPRGRRLLPFSFHSRPRPRRLRRPSPTTRRVVPPQQLPLQVRGGCALGEISTPSPTGFLLHKQVHYASAKHLVVLSTSFLNSNCCLPCKQYG